MANCVGRNEMIASAWRVHLRAERLGDLDAARRRFGNTTLLREQSRDQWTFRSLDNRAHDFV